MLKIQRYLLDERNGLDLNLDIARKPGNLDRDSR